MKLTLKQIAALLIAASSLLAVPAARADDPIANALIEQGVQLREQGDDTGALVLFERAFEMNHSPRAEAQIGLAELALGHWVRAHRRLEAALAHSSDSWISSRAVQLAAAVETLVPHLGFLQIEGGANGYHVWVQGTDAGALPFSTLVVVETGRVDVELRDALRTLDSLRVTVAPRATVRVTLATPAEPEHVSSRPPILAWTSFGAGVVGLGIGVAFHAMRESAVSSAASCLTPTGALDANQCDRAIFYSRTDSARRDTTVAAIAYSAGGALVVTGIILLFLQPRTTDDEGNSASFSCAPNGLSIGATCSGSF